MCESYQVLLDSHFSEYACSCRKMVLPPPPGGGPKMSIFKTPLGPQKFWVLTLETPPRGVGGPEPNYGPLSDLQFLALTVGLW